MGLPINASLVLVLASLGGVARAADQALQMPAMIVTDKSSFHWLYGEADHTRFISCADLFTTQAFVDEYLRRQQEIGLLWDPRLQPKNDCCMIILSRSAERILGDQTQALMTERARREEGIPILQFAFNACDTGTDTDTRVVVADRVDWSHLEIMKGSVAAMLDSRRPRLPAWYKEGVFNLYAITEWSSGEPQVLTTDSIYWPVGDEGAKQRRLLPMEAVLAGPPTGLPRTSREFRVWSFQATLFARYVLWKGGKEGLYQWVRRTEREAPSEALFRECFGAGYAEMQHQLESYMLKADLDRLKLGNIAELGPTDCSFLPASPEQVAEIQGEFTRNEIPYVRNALKAPAMAKTYETALQVKFDTLLDEGDRDPAFLAEAGLFYADCGQDEKALPLLQKAIGAKLRRPTIYIEAARIQLASAVKADPSKPLDAAATRALLALLEESGAFGEPQERALTLAMRVWNHSELKLSKGELEALKARIVNFPEHRPMHLVSLAMLSEAAGLAPETDALFVEARNCFEAGSVGRRDVDDLEKKIRKVDASPVR